MSCVIIHYHYIGVCRVCCNFSVPNRKCQHSLAFFWLIRAIFTGRGFWICWMQRWSPKCCHFLFPSPNRKRQYFPASSWFVPFSQEGGFSGCQKLWWRLKCEYGTDQSIKDRKLLALPVWLAKQKVKPFWTSPLCSSSLGWSFGLFYYSEYEQTYQPLIKLKPFSLKTL